jgi:hypothetical protein
MITSPLSGFLPIPACLTGRARGDVRPSRPGESRPDDLEQRSVQRRPRLVRGNGVDRAANHPLEDLRLDLEREIRRHVDPCGKLLRTNAVELEPSGLGSDIQGQFLGFEFQLFLGQLSHELGETLCRDRERAFGFDVRRRAGGDREVEIRCRHLDRSSMASTKMLERTGRVVRLGTALETSCNAVRISVCATVNFMATSWR